MAIPEELKQLVAAKKESDPELFEKYGDPTDENDPRFWQPSDRAEKGVSPEDRLKFLELDVEAMALAFGPVLKWVIAKQVEEMKAKVKEDPIGFLQSMLETGADPAQVTEILKEVLASRGSYGPNGESGHAYAGSTQGIAPDTMVDSINGPIRADQIPGYRNDPNWRPSPDWVDANCTCENHKALRAQHNDGEADGGFGEQYGNGLYL
jgi:hypothetical protein